MVMFLSLTNISFYELINCFRALSTAERILDFNFSAFP